MVKKEQVPDPDRIEGAKRFDMMLGNDNNDTQVAPPEYDLVDGDPMLW